MTILIALLGILLSCYLLAIVCDRYFVESLDEIAKKRNLSDDVAGATLMAIGSSAPEFFTALIALFHGGKVGLGAGTIIGSAIFNILVIIGASAFFLNVVLDKRVFIRDSFFYVLAIGLIFRSFQNGSVGVWEAGMFLVLYVVYVLYLKQSNGSKHTRSEAIAEVGKEVARDEAILEKKIFILKRIGRLIQKTFPASRTDGWYRPVFFISILRISGLSRLLVESGIILASSLGVPEIIIGLTILAAGTSVPDLISSVIVAKQGRGDMAVTNALGSNIFDICVCLGLPRLIYAIRQGVVPVKTGDLTFSVGLLLGILSFVFATFVVTRFRIFRGVGIVFLLAYLIYLGRAIRSAVG